jgi:hypothetical protein
MMNLREFVLVPTTKIGSGNVVGNLSEAVIISRYIKALADELDACSIRNRIGDAPHSHEFVIRCGLGWHRGSPHKLPAENSSRVYIGQHDASSVATLISEALSHWGKVYCSHGHRSSKPVVDQDDEQLRAGSGGVRIEPFVLNGANAALYAQRLENLGRDVGRIVADYVAKGNHGAYVKSTTAAQLMPRMARQPF